METSTGHGRSQDRLHRPCGCCSKDSKRLLRRFALEVAALSDRNRRLEHLLNELRRALHGQKSEKLHPDQFQLAFEELEGDCSPRPRKRPRRARRGRHVPSARIAQRNIGHLPAHLPRIEEVIEPESTLCPCGCGEMVRIGEDRTERLDIVPAQLRVIVTVRPKYACRACEEGVTQAPAPARLIEGALPTEGLLAHVLVSKYADHLPLYRQSQILARSGIDLHRSTLADWVGKASFHLRHRGRLPGGGTEEVGEAWTRPRFGFSNRAGAGPGRATCGRWFANEAAVVRRGPAGCRVSLCARPRRHRYGEKLLEGFSGTHADRRLFGLQPAAPV